MARSVGRRADYTWQGLAAGGFVVDAIGAAGSFVQVALMATAGTIMRCRGNILATLDVGAASDKAVIGMGLIVATESQVTAGTTAIPSPLTDLDEKWIWHSFGCLQNESGAQGDELGTQQRFEVDSKAMRRFKQTESLLLVFDVVVLAGSPTVDVVGGIRALFAD